MRIIIYQKAEVDYPASEKGTAQKKNLIQDIREKLELRPYPQDIIEVFDYPDEDRLIAKEQKTKQETEIEILKNRYVAMASNPPLSAYANHNQGVIEDYEGTMKDLERQLREAGVMP